MVYSEPLKSAAKFLDQFVKVEIYELGADIYIKWAKVKNEIGKKN
jgi:hypothetical protein